MHFPTVNLHALLRPVTPFAPVLERRYVEALSSLQPQRFEKGAIIFSGFGQGQTFLIIEGQVAILSGERSIAQALVRLFGPGDSFSAHTLRYYGSEPYAKALTSGAVSVLNDTRLAQIEEECPDFLFRLRSQVGYAERYRFLSQSKLFTHLHSSIISQLALAARPLSVATGEVILREGSPGEHMYLVRSGYLEVSRNGTALSELGPGDHFGETAILTHEDRAATVKAIAACELVSLSRKDLEAVLSAHASLREGMVISNKELGENVPDTLTLTPPPVELK